MIGTPGGPLRVANVSGYYGDRLAAAREALAERDLHVITGDYLAELTMYLLHKTRERDPSGGFARTFLAQMEQVLAPCLERGVRVVANAGGLNPGGLAERLAELCDRLGLSARIAYVSGDDVTADVPGWLEDGLELAHLDTGRPLAELDRPIATANAYLGAWGIRHALVEGADVVICPRVTDAALIVGPAAAAFGWERDDWDRLAGAVVCGHVLECGAQATGGNFSFFAEVPDGARPGFPIAEIEADGSAVITKPPGSGGMVTVDTVTAQLVYEIGGPRYANPDVVARFDTVALAQEGPDRVRIGGVRGEPAPAEAKVAINYVGGHRNEMTMVLTGLDVERKADVAMRSLRDLWGDTRFDELHVDLLRTDRADPRRNEDACAFLRVTVKDRDRGRAGRRFSDAFVQAALSSYPGFFLTTPPQGASEYAIYWPTLVPAERVPHHVTLWDGSTVDIPPPPGAGSAPEEEPPPARAERNGSGPTVRVPLGRVFGTRSGDKGGGANLGVWARSAEHYDWLEAYLTVDRLLELLPDLREHAVDRHRLDSLRALNFVVHGLLGEGVAAATRLDRQAKGLGEYLGCRPIDVPETLAP